MIPYDPLQDIDHLVATDPLADVNCKAFTGMIVHYR